jgi:hypothetical protein
MPTIEEIEALPIEAAPGEDDESGKKSKKVKSRRHAEFDRTFPYLIRVEETSEELKKLNYDPTTEAEIKKLVD